MNNEITFEKVKEIANSKKSLREISDETYYSIGQLRYFLCKFGLKKCRKQMRTWTDEQMISAISKSNSFSDVLKMIGLKVRPGNYATIKRFIKEKDIDISHMSPYKKDCYVNNLKKGCRPLSELLVKDSPCAGKTSLKRRILASGLLKNICHICGCTEWNGKELKMILDHINGENDDYRLENLRMLCPNCDSQQETFCRGGRKKNKHKKEYRCSCGSLIERGSKQCQRCSSISLRKVKRPSVENLSSDIKEMSWVAIGKKYGVSDNAVRKWARSYGILE